MRLQSKSTMRYTAKNFLHFLPLTLLPALMLAFFLPPFGPIQFFDYLFDVVAKTPKVVFEDFYQSLYRFFSFISVGYQELFGIDAIWLWIITLVVSLLGICMMFSFVERHIKYGTRRYEKLLMALNETFLSVVPFTLLVVAFYELWMLLLCGCIVLSSVMFSGMTFYVVSVVLTVIFYMAFFIVLSMALLTPPCMFFDGYKFSLAVGYSFQLAHANFKDIVTTILLNVIATIVLFALYDWAISAITNLTVEVILYYFGRFLLYLWWIVLLPCLSCCKYADYTETARADLKMKLF